MDQDDPENRIAELERQLAEQKRMAELKRQQAGSVRRPGITPEYVRNMAFSKPTIGKRGYDEAEVDAFLDRVEAVLQDPIGSTLTSEQVRNMAFSKPPLGKRGYDETEVDAFLDLVEAALVGSTESDTFGKRGNEESAATGKPILDELHMTSPEPGLWLASDGKRYPAQPENRCLLMAIPSVWKRHPSSLSVEVGKDAMWVFDPHTNALIALASLGQVTATPAKFRENGKSEWGGMTVRTRPVLVVGVPGLQPLIIGSPVVRNTTSHGLILRFAWRGQVGEAKRPRYRVTDADWLTLVGKLGLVPSLEDRTEHSADGSW